MSLDFRTPWTLISSSYRALDRAVFPPRQFKESRQMATRASAGDVVTMEMDIGDVNAVMSALRNRRDHHQRQIIASASLPRVEQHHRDFYEALDRACRNLSDAADAVNRM